MCDFSSMTTASSYPASLLGGKNSSTMPPEQHWKLEKAEEVEKSKLLRVASVDLEEFIWPQDERPSVPHNDFQGAEGLPLIDMGELQTGIITEEEEGAPSHRRNQIAKDLVKSFSDWGFVQLVNHGVSTHVIQAMQTQAQKFFDLPLEQKEKGKLIVTPGSTNKNEGFGYGVESGIFYVGRPWIDRFQCRWSPVDSIPDLADNVYSEDAHDAQEFSGSMQDYNRSLDKLTVQILELCAEGLGLESSTFTKAYLGTAGDCIARMNYYPPCPLPSLTLGLGAHSDPNLLTILHQCKVGGLQIYRDGSWFSVKPLPNSFIVNVGDSFEAWTNGRFKSVKHRAVVNATASRLSIAYFSNPPSSSIMTIPQKLINSQHPLQFRPAFTWGEYKSHLMEMHQKPNGIKASKAWLRSSSSSINSHSNPSTKTSPHFLMLNSDNNNNNNNNCMYQSDVSFNLGI